MTVIREHASAYDKRNSRVLQAGVSAIVCKGLVLLVNAVSIPITVRYLGAVDFGIWVTIASSLAMLIVLDLGISSAVSNRLSEAYALDDPELAGQYATTALVVVTLIAIGLGLAGAIVWPFVPWAELFHLTGDASRVVVSHAIAVAYTIFLFGLPASLAAKFLGSYQEIGTANLFAAIGAVANLAAVVLVIRLHGGLVALVAASSGATVGTNLACLFWLWYWHKPWLSPRRERWQASFVRPLMQGGSEFFVLQLAGLIVFNSDNFVIAHFLGPQQVTPYSVTWRLVGYTTALQTVIAPALWPAYAEAWVRRDMQWIRRTFRLTMLTTMGTVGCGTAVLVFWGRTLVRLWAGPAAVPSETLLVLMCVWILLSTFMGNTATILLATNHTRMQAWLSVLAATLNLAASIWLVQRIGSVGVILGTVGSYMAVLLIPQTCKVLQVLGTGDGLD